MRRNVVAETFTLLPAGGLQAKHDDVDDCDHDRYYRRHALAAIATTVHKDLLQLSAESHWSSNKRMSLWYEVLFASGAAT